MWRKARTWGATVMVVGGTAMLGVAGAGADATPAGDFSFRFSTAAPDAATGLAFRQLYKNPSDPGAKPSPVRRFLFAAPEGTVFDGSAVPVCNATDQQFQMMGKAACPVESVVGAGFITVMTGFPGEQPLPADATVFNSGDGLIELFTEQGTGIFLAIERPKFRGENAFEDTDIAPTPGGPPDGQSAAREAYLEFPVSRGPDGRSFITTPPECPGGRRWTARFEWTNDDGNSYSNEDDTECVRPGAVPCANRITGTDERDELRGTERSDQISGKRGDDRMSAGAGADCLFGKGGDDRLEGNGGSDEIRGGGGEDELEGNGGEDDIRPGRGADEIEAGGGRDVIRAAAGGHDVIDCGGGRDTTFVNGRDRLRRCERVKTANT